MKLDFLLEQSELTVIKNKIRNYSLSWSEQQKKEPPHYKYTGKTPISSEFALRKLQEEAHQWN